MQTKSFFKSASKHNLILTDQQLFVKPEKGYLQKNKMPPRVHFHIAIHVKDAPKLDQNTDENITKFVDKHISFSLPDEDQDKDLHELVTLLQIHKHSQTCQKKRINPDDSFSPRIARPPDSDTDPIKLTLMKTILQEVYEAMLNSNLAEPLTFESLLQSLGITVELYTEALQMCTKRHILILQREAHAQFVNNYHPVFLQTQRGNMDIQLVLDTYACVMYVTNYLCKSEKTMSELLKQASIQCKKRAMNIKEKLSVFEMSI